MKYGLCNLSIVPVRLEAADTSEMVTQALYGDTFKVLEQRKKWSRIRFYFDKYEGYIDNKQFLTISEEEYTELNNTPAAYSADVISMIVTEKEQLITIPLGCTISAKNSLQHTFEGTYIASKQPKAKIIDTALLYLNAPYLWGGKTPFGIDCSGFTQMCYKINGHALLRDASEQATQGDPLSFIEESEPGDLAFFDNAEGNIIHVGIIMEDNYIIHAHGHVRIDRLDHTGIFNYKLGQHTHKLRVIKRII
ncbi:C40 family peptidase [Rasiella rasia]|uniref:C40 family peptidase n=1 Tax=Rasiella rasia TaxID=2744027 RepID=A0A6G6GJ87_9FLAO|nr:C40 family peptidase [Rasiella rasia]QIE58483.1 C40 family peptidase [Rasiella rasia]